MNITFENSQVLTGYLDHIDSLADRARLAVVGNAVRVEEYRRAFEQAKAYQDAGYTGDVGSNVQAWADAKEWTAQQAAEDILAAAARWYGALDAIRAKRLKAKEDVRKATTTDSAATIANAFRVELDLMMQGVA